jgi:hypothetical protein
MSCLMMPRTILPVLALSSNAISISPLTRMATTSKRANISRLYRLQHAPHPDPTFGYFVLSKPIACIFHVSAACVALLGSMRFFRQQNAMAAGKVRAGGWEVMVIGVYVLLVSMRPKY